MKKIANINAMMTRYPHLFTPRATDSHKGTFGTLGVIGGAEGMVGAALLAGASALYGGCGKVIVGFAQEYLPLPVWQNMPELMLDTAENILQREHIDAWVMGCGLGQQRQAVLWIENIWLSARFQSVPVVLDADALNILSQFEDMPRANKVVVLTPHPAEAARLLKTTVSEVQQDRILAAVHLAQKYTAWVVLKGHHTVIASPQGQTQINFSGNPNLAVAGSGDVLAGLIGSLLAQSMPIEEAVSAGVWLHGQAADHLAAEGLALGLRATQLCEAIRTVRNHLLTIKQKENEQ